MNKLILLLCVFSIGCATSHHKKTSNLNRSSEKSKPGLAQQKPKPINDSEQEDSFRQKEDQRQNERDRSLVLQRKSQLSGTGRISLNNTPQGVLAGRSMTVQPVSDLNLSEAQLFTELFASYEKFDVIGFHSRMKLFVKKYPQSARIDDVYYLSGMMSLASKDYGPALKEFNRIITVYPFSNKKVAALFAKGAVLKKMEMPELAKAEFNKIVARYPGSPEALRARNELRLMK